MDLKSFKCIPEISDKKIESGDIVFAFPGKLCYVSAIINQTYICKTPDNKIYGEFYRSGLRLLWKSNMSKIQQLTV